MPTGVSLRDARAQLLAAAERVLRRGPGALTTRAITAEAGCAKGVLHRHFTDLDDLLVALVREHVDRLGEQSARLRAAAGRDPVVPAVAAALTEFFGPVALSVVGLIIARDGLRARLRAVTPTGVPLLTEGAAMLAGHLAAEREHGRIDPAADVDVLAATLIGTVHLAFAGRDGEPPPAAEVERLVAGVLSRVLVDPRTASP
ncbi:transcriptional regulator, TetR family [Pseudonocardia thermophila]|uniref:Transcriptional regulator, TetR family n=1 Tax=Pseudonocardia thermophila TaxID=1848 RepID=A0A1M6RNI4_PSETH|nr:TetR/AcrR family transcriptional regulator [Pseudonocardia thermophila]SHK33999.1 transcriptional regulator, TetR family [Pseudonocardia thermophila]